MRVKKAKFIRKYLRFYRIVYEIKDPYDIILDGNFIFNGLKYKVDIRERLGKLLQGAVVKLYIMESSLKELEAVGSKTSDAVTFAKQYCTIINDNEYCTPYTAIANKQVNKNIIKNGNSDEEQTPAQRMHNMFESFRRDERNGNKSLKSKKYFVATQDKELRHRLGKAAGIPLVYLNKVTMVLEPPSDASKEHNREVEESKASLNANESSIVDALSASKRKKRQEVSIITTTDNNSTSPTKISSSSSFFASSSSSSSSSTDAVKNSERKKRKAVEANPLSSRIAADDSNKSKKRKLDKFKRR